MIGEKIKAIRMEKKITAKELAERVEVTPGYISQIERDLISPSLSVLMRIADAIETPLASLLSQEAREQVTVVRKDKRTKIQFADINGEPLSGAEKRLLHLLGNEKNTVLLAEGIELFHEDRMGRQQSGVTLDRLDDHRCHLLRGQIGGKGLFDHPDTIPLTGGIRCLSASAFSVPISR